MKPIYIAAYHQSRFGKLLAMDVPAIVTSAVESACRTIDAAPAAIDVGSIGAACQFTLNQQGLLSGLMAMTPGLASKPIESVENACASGGQAVVSVIQKLQCGLGEVGVAVGYEKMRDSEGKMDGKRIGEVLGYYSHPDERAGKVFVFPHIFAEIMADYMRVHGATERDLAAIAVQEYANARENPCAHMRNVTLTVDDACTIGGINRYIVDGLPLKTYDCSQISDGYASMILATDEGLTRLGVKRQDAVRVAGWAQATDPLKKRGREILKPAGAYAAMGRAYEMAGLDPRDVNVAEIHDCFTVAGAIGTEVIGKAEYGKGVRYWLDGHAAPDGECGINTSGGLIAKGHPVGATGVAMIGWCAWQLLGKAPAPLQVHDARAAATFNIGGPLCASVCTVLTH